jgi:CBS domain-containing protein
MMDRYVRHVLVEEDGSLVGIVSARDVLGAYAAADVDDEEDADLDARDDDEDEDEPDDA